LLRLDEIISVSIPTVEQESARDLVRAREDCRGDLMRARHRLSKLLLRHGIVYSGGHAWTDKHDAWLRHEALTALTSRATRMTFDSDYDAVLMTKARRDRLDAEIEEMASTSEFTPVVRRLGGRDRRLAPLHRQQHRLFRRAGPLRALLGRVPIARIDHQDRKHPRPPATGRGSLAPPAQLPNREDHARPVGPGTSGGPRPRR
jgi:transposase